MDTTNLTVTATVHDTMIPNPTNPRGRPVKGRMVGIGWIRATERSLPAAKAEATRQLQNWIDAADGPPKVLKWGNLCAVLTAVPTSSETGIAVFLVVSGMAHDGSFVCWQSNGRHDGWREAEAYARRRMTDAACDLFDNASIAESVQFLQSYRHTDEAREVVRSAGWQRAYRHAAENGEADPHTWAGNHHAEFAPTLANVTVG